MHMRRDAIAGFHEKQWYNRNMFKRHLDLRSVLRSKSALLLGPRQTGKSTLLRQTFPEALLIDLWSELTAWRAYVAPDARLSYWRSLSQLEVDFVVDIPPNRVVGIEVKSTTNVGRRDIKGLLALKDDVSHLEMIVVADEPAERRTAEGVRIVPVETFCRQLWHDGL
jgi:predicted AAA+ superfamily ATPase